MKQPPRPKTTVTSSRLAATQVCLAFAADFGFTAREASLSLALASLDTGDTSIEATIPRPGLKYAAKDSTLS